MNDLNKLSEDLLLAVKMEKNIDALRKALATIPRQQLFDFFPFENAEKAFWINLYNAYFLILRKIDQVEKATIYTERQIDLAEQKFSLDDIEHGILRRYRYKKSLGYFPDIFAPKHIKELALSRIDYRIHFALNCGAKSCPPIAFYKADKVDEQLDVATCSFLEGETDVDEDKKEIHISRLFLWYLADFGGMRGIHKILKNKLNLDSSKYKLHYKKYNWEEDLNNFS